MFRRFRKYRVWLVLTLLDLKAVLCHLASLTTQINQSSFPFFQIFKLINKGLTEQDGQLTAVTVAGEVEHSVSSPTAACNHYSKRQNTENLGKPACSHEWDPGTSKRSCAL